MTEAIVAAIVTGLIGLIGTVTTVVITTRQNRIRMQFDMDKQQVLLKAELDHVKTEMTEIKADLKSHNGYAQMFSEAIPVIKEQIKVANHRIDDLEKKVG